MKVIRAVILIVVILGLTYLVFHISKLNDDIVNLEEEVEVQKVFVEQLEEDKKELTVERNILEVDIDAIELDKQLLEKEVDKLHYKYEDCKRSKKSIEPSRGSHSRGRLLGTFEATAYDLSVASCGKSESHPAYGITANGTSLKGHTLESARAIAVDPKVIKLGSTVYVEFLDEGYKHLTGEFRAVDTGGAIKGSKIDVFFGSGNVAEQVKQFGRRKVKVWIVK